LDLFIQQISQFCSAALFLTSLELKSIATGELLDPDQSTSLFTGEAVKKFTLMEL